MTIIEELKALRKKTTRGKWKLKEHNPGWEDNSENNGAYLCALHNSAPKLIKALEVAIRSLATIRDDHESIRCAEARDGPPHVDSSCVSCEARRGLANVRALLESEKE